MKNKEHDTEHKHDADKINTPTPPQVMDPSTPPKQQPDNGRQSPDRKPSASSQRQAKGKDKAAGKKPKGKSEDRTLTPNEEL